MTTAARSHHGEMRPARPAAAAPSRGLRPGQMSSRPIRKLQGILAPVLTDFAFRDLPPHCWQDGEDLPPVEVLAHHGAFPEPGDLIRDLENPLTGQHLLSVYEGEHGLQWRVDGLGTFWLDATGWRVRYALTPDASLADAESLLLGPVLGVAAQQRGETLLHASSVLVDGGVVAFSAPHGMGKSTLAASFIEAGLPLASDDILPLRWTSQGPLAEPYFPRTKLREDSLRTLRGEAAPGGEPAVSWFDKQRHRVGDGWGTVALAAAPLRTVVFLNPSANPRQPIDFSRVTGMDAVLLLQACVYSPQTLRGPRAVRALEASTHLANSVPVVRAAYHRDYGVLPDLRRALLDYLRAPGMAVAG